MHCITDIPARGGTQCEGMQIARNLRTNGVQPRASVTNDTFTISSSAALARHKGKGAGGRGGGAKTTKRTGSALAFVFCLPLLTTTGSALAFVFYLPLLIDLVV